VKNTLEKRDRIRRALIIEDNQESARILKNELQSKGQFQVDLYTDPFSSLQNFKAGLYDVVLIDLILAKTSNNEICSKIMHMDKKVKICYMSGTYQNYEEVREMFPESERECFISRPVETQVLLEKLG
jgi:DNA-binding response OmpR family regulator